MSERTRKFSDALKRLILEGDILYMAIQYDCHPEACVEQVNETFKHDKEEVEKYLKKIAIVQGKLSKMVFRSTSRNNASLARPFGGFYFIL